MAKKTVGIQLPRQAQNQTSSSAGRWSSRASAPVADIVEIRADTPAEFAAGVARRRRDHHLLGPAHRPAGDREPEEAAS